MAQKARQQTEGFSSTGRARKEDDLCPRVDGTLPNENAIYFIDSKTQDISFLSKRVGSDVDDNAQHVPFYP